MWFVVGGLESCGGAGWEGERGEKGRGGWIPPPPPRDPGEAGHTGPAQKGGGGVHDRRDASSSPCPAVPPPPLTVLMNGGNHMTVRRGYTLDTSAPPVTHLSSVTSGDGRLIPRRPHPSQGGGEGKAGFLRHTARGGTGCRGLHPRPRLLYAIAECGPV